MVDMGKEVYLFQEKCKAARLVLTHTSVGSYVSMNILVIYLPIGCI